MYVRSSMKHGNKLVHMCESRGKCTENLAKARTEVALL